MKFLNEWNKTLKDCHDYKTIKVWFFFFVDFDVIIEK